MPDPLLMFFARSAGRQPGRQRRRRPLTQLPHEDAHTDAVFIVLRRMRFPLLLLLGIFVVATVGLSLIPGQDADGNPRHLTLFESFYFVSYMAATIGFGELGTFTTGQRMWVTLCIYLTVIGWAYAIGTLLTLAQDQGFQEAVRTQRFRRRVARLREPFVLIAGYGQAGRLIAGELDEYSNRLVVVDDDPHRIEKLTQAELLHDVPGLDGDARRPSTLLMAGLTNPRCKALVAVTGSDEANLAALMTASLTRPTLPTIGRAGNRVVEERMRDFGPEAVLNPADLFGAYLMLALQRPATYDVVTRLMAGEGRPSVTNRHQLKRGRWLVVSDDAFGDEITSDLRRAGNDVARSSPADRLPDLDQFVGVVAGSASDTTNIAIAERAHAHNPQTFSVVRQNSPENAVLLEPLGVNSVYNPHVVVANEVLARLTSPLFWDFVQEALERPEEWSEAVLATLHQRCSPDVELERSVVTIEPKGAPALDRAVRERDVTLDELLRDPDERERRSAIVPLVLVRGGQATHGPGMDTVLRSGDQILFAGASRHLDGLMELLTYSSSLEYVLTGRDVPDGWLFRRLRRR